MPARLLFAAALGLAAAAPAAAGERALSPTVHFLTADGCRIEADFLAPSRGGYAFINTHGLGSNRGEWAPLHEALKSRGHGWLSLDMRGHGGSTACAGGKADYRKFTGKDWAAASLDIAAAAAWLKKKGVPPERTVLCGASIGANLSLKAAAGHGLKPAAVILLSPGMDYAGIRPAEYLSRAAKYRLLIAAAENDPYSWRSSVPIFRAAREAGLRTATVDGGSGHGANMLKHPGTLEKILDWLTEP